MSRTRVKRIKLIEYSAADPDNYKTVLEAICSWPIEVQDKLVYNLAVIRTTQSRPMSFKRAEGMLKAAGAPPSDEEVEALLEEERLKKYS